MREKHSKKILMYQAIFSVLENNIHQIKTIMELNIAYEHFISYFNKLIELQGEFNKEIQPLVDKKSVSRENLIKLTVPVVNILQVYAFDFSDKALAKKVDISKNKLTKSRDSVLVEKTELIWKTAKQLFGKHIHGANAEESKKAIININNYGITGQMIDELETAVKSFVENILILKNAIAHKNKCGKKITERIKEVDSLLKNKIDKLMSVFDTKDQVFYRNYIISRVIAKAEAVAENVETKSSEVKEETSEVSTDNNKTEVATSKAKSKKTVVTHE